MNYDPIETCPYDSVHRILRSRMQFHLSKCAKNWPNTKKKQCPYDARHIINEIEFNYHISICQQRESVLHYKIVENEAVKPSKILPIDLTPAAASTEENWEEDVKVQSYNPMKNSESRPVTRILIGASKSERKKHQRQERLRISRLEEETKKEKRLENQSNINQQTLSSMKSSAPKKVSAEAEEEYKPLRRPKKLPLDSSKISEFSSINNSTAVNQTQNSVNQNKSVQPVIQEKSNTKENIVLQPKEVYSYAAALKHQQNSSIDSKYDVVIESIKFDIEKENTSSVLNNTIDENLIKVSKTVEELSIGDKGHKVQSESLDRTLESLKRTEKNMNKSNDNNPFTVKKSSRCAAKFTNSKMK